MEISVSARDDTELGAMSVGLKLPMEPRLGLNLTLLFPNP